MTNQDKQYYIYLRSTKERVPVTKEEFDNYYRDINAYRQKQQYRGRCVCPQKKHLDCDMDCETCPFRRAGNTLSLNCATIDGEGEESEWLDEIEDRGPLVEDIVADGQELSRLFARIVELMPQAIEIGNMRQMGMSDTSISAEIGIPRKTFTDRIKKTAEVLKKEFPDFFEKFFFFSAKTAISSAVAQCKGYPDTAPCGR